MRGNSQSAKKSERRRKCPALADKKERTPESPRRELRGDEKGGCGVDLKNGAKQTGKRRVSGKEGDVRNFHHLVINRRNSRLIAAVDNVGEPVTIVLNETLVAIRKRALGGQQENRHCELDQSHSQAGYPRTK